MTKLNFFRLLTFLSIYLSDGFAVFIGGLQFGKFFGNRYRAGYGCRRKQNDANGI